MRSCSSSRRAPQIYAGGRRADEPGRPLAPFILALCATRAPLLSLARAAPHNPLPDASEKQDLAPGITCKRPGFLIVADTNAPAYRSWAPTPRRPAPSRTTTNAVPIRARIAAKSWESRRSATRRTEQVEAAVAAALGTGEESCRRGPPPPARNKVVGASRDSLDREAVAPVVDDARISGELRRRRRHWYDKPRSL